MESDRSRVRRTHGQDKVTQAVAEADFVCLGVQPRDLGELFETPDIVELLKEKTIISMLAGVSVSELLKHLTRDQSRPVDKLRIARIIPTLGATQGDSVTLLADGYESSDAPWYRQVEELLSQVGAVIRVPERLMDSATAIGAAVHALAIVAIDTVPDASVASGVPRDVAKAIAAQSLKGGSGLMAGDGAMSPEQVKSAMSTPGGITLNAVINLDKGARSEIASAVQRAIEYAAQMNG